MAYFTDFLNRIFTPSEGMEWKYEMGPEPDRYSEEFYNGFGAQPTYTLVPKRGETLSSAPPSVYNRPARQDIGPRPQAVVDVGTPDAFFDDPLNVAATGILGAAALAGPGKAAVDSTRGALKKRQQSAAKKIGNLDLRPAGTQKEFDLRGGQAASRSQVGAGPAKPEDMGKAPKQRDLFDKPVIKGPPAARAAKPKIRVPDVLSKGGVATSAVIAPLVFQQALAAGYSPMEAAQMAGIETAAGSLGVGELGGGMDVVNPGMMGGMPMAGFGFVPAQPDFTLGGMLRPQAFDNVNDILIDQYLEGISPWADVTYYK